MPWAAVGAVVGVVGAVVGAATSIIGASQQASAQKAMAEAQMQQAENTRAIAQYNANIARQNNEVQYQMALYQAQYAAHMAQVNQSMMLASASMAETQSAYAQRGYEQGLENAKQQEEQAKASRAQAREAADRERAKNELQLSTIRSKYAASGVTFEGSPLVVLADAARLGEATVQDLAYSGELQSRKELREAANQRFTAYGSLLEAQGHSVEAMNFRNKATMYGYDADLGEYDSAIAGARYRIGLNQAKLIELGGEEKAVSYEYGAQQSRYAASASLISGVGGGIAQGISGIGSAASSYGYATGKLPYKGA